MNPATSERNFTPSSTGASGPPSTVPGTVELGQMLKVDTIGTVILSGAVVVSVGRLASLTWTMKLKVPGTVGVPVMAPVLVLRVRPSGREPLAIDQMYGVLPPLADTFAV